MNKSTLSWVDLYSPSSEFIYENNKSEFIIPENEQIFILDKYKDNVLFITNGGNNSQIQGFKQFGGGKYDWLGCLHGENKKYLMKGGKNSIEVGFKILQTTKRKNKNIKVEIINLKNFKKHIIQFTKNIF